MNKMILIFLLLSFNAFSLEIDEKLTLRILRVSDSKKTVLINRGLEDGLAEGDHAKIFLTTGVVARGVVTKVSPTRSVWSLYRLVTPEVIKEDTVMNLKITPAVRVTEDDTKMITKEPVVDSPAPDKLDIPLAEGADDVERTADGQEVKALMVEQPVSLLLRNYEAYGFINFSSLSGTSKAQNADTPATMGQDNYNFNLGGSYYFTNEAAWYSRFSLGVFWNYEKNLTSSAEGNHSNMTVVEYGVLTDWHPIFRPWVTETFIPFVEMGMGRGSISTNYKNTNTATNATAVDLTSTLSSFSMGLGAKYYFRNAFGVKFLVDYYARSASFPGVTNTGNISYEYAVNGMRTFIGISYRW